MSGHELNGRTCRRADGHGVGRDLLTAQVLEEPVRPLAGQAVDEPGDRVEQRHHGIEVAIGGRGGRSARQRRCRPPGGQAGRGPHRPQHVLGRGPGLARRRTGRAHQPTHPDGRCDGSWVQRRQHGGLLQRLDEQIGRRAAATGSELVDPQLLAQVTQRQLVGTSQRTRDQ